MALQFVPSGVLAMNLEQEGAVAKGNATIILEVGDVWGDGTGYQMILDADANTYGTLIPEIGSSNGYFQGSDYSEFEYLAPENATASDTTSNYLINTTYEFEIPAGIYDFSFVYPYPYEGLYIPGSGNGSMSRADDYEFQDGYTYHFTISSYMGSDLIELEVIIPTATIMIEIGNPWGDWSGYAMLLDQDATAYGGVIPTVESMLSSYQGTTFNDFEYTCPSILLCQSDCPFYLIEEVREFDIPVGTYDFAFIHFQPYVAMYMANAEDGSMGRADDFKFEAGYTTTSLSRESATRIM